MKNVLFSFSKCEKWVSWNQNQVRNRLLLTGLRVWSIILVITRTAHIRQTFTLISIKLMWILKFLFSRNRVFKHKEIVSNLHVCWNGLGKLGASYIFHFFTKNSNLHTHMKKFNTFLHNICRDVQHSLFRSR